MAVFGYETHVEGFVNVRSDGDLPFRVSASVYFNTNVEPPKVLVDAEIMFNTTNAIMRLAGSFTVWAVQVDIAFNPR